MKIKHTLSSLVVISSLLISYIAVELWHTWQQVQDAIVQNEQAERVDFWINKLEGDFYIYQLNESSLSIHTWQQSFENLQAELNHVPITSAKYLPMLKSISTQTKGLKTLFDGLIEIKGAASKREISLHFSEKIIANIHTIREESRYLSANTRDQIIELISAQLTSTIPLLLMSMAMLSAASIYIIRWLRKSLLDLNSRLDLLQDGHLGSIVPPKSNDDFLPIYQHINFISQRLTETTISRDTLQNIVDERTKSLENLANTDPLTQIATRRVLFKRGKEEFSRAKRKSLALSVMMIDCDYFKKINDTYGHSCGDGVLIHLCRIFEHEIRDIDILARFGGEEFVIILPDTISSAAFNIAKRIQKGIKKNAYISKGDVIPITVSIGIASMSAFHKNFEQIIDDADNALYAAKESGRNTINLAELG